MQPWQRNLRLIRILRTCFSLVFAVSVITLYWRKYGLDLMDFFLLQAIFAVAIAVFEIPTGYLGDRMGRKRTLMLSCTVVALGWILYAAANSFWLFAVAEVILGLGVCFFSGTDTSLVYESLKTMGEEERFTAVEGKQLGQSQVAEALAALSGGLLAFYCPIEYLFLASAAAMGVGWIACWKLTEPQRDCYQHPKGTWYGLYKIARYIFLRSRMVRFAVPLLAACSLSTMLGVWLYQPLWQEKGVPVWMFGALWALMSLPAAVASHYAHALEKRIGPRTMLWLLLLPAVLGYALAAFIPGWWPIAFIYLVPLLRGLGMPLIAKYIHEETFSDKRATVMSVMSWLFRLWYFILGPTVGWIGKNHGLSAAFMACALIALVALLVFIPGLAKNIGVKKSIP